MNLSPVTQRVNLWAMKQMLTLSQEQAGQILSPNPGGRTGSPEPAKGTLIDVRV